MDEFEFRQCEWDDCRFRFPVLVDELRAARCPHCGAATAPVGYPIDPDRTAAKPDSAPFSALLDNIRSIHNVGSMFRTADGADLRHLYLCGITATPAQLKLAKAALGAQETMSWSHQKNGVDLAQQLKEQGHQLWAIEDTPHAESFYDANLAIGSRRVTIVFGNERAGIDPGILSQCDRILYLPMAGHKHSLNVAVVFGIVSYHLRYAHCEPKIAG
mgnify:CR=1 FL=1